MQTNIRDSDCNAKLFKHEHEIKQFRPLIDIYLHPDLHLYKYCILCKKAIKWEYEMFQISYIVLALYRGSSFNHKVKEKANLSFSTMTFLQNGRQLT